MMLRRLALAALLALAPSLACAQFATIGPTPLTSDNGDRLATTAWVNNFFASGLPLSSGKIFIGSAGNLAAQQTPSGDCTLSVSGVITCTRSAGDFTVNGVLSVTGGELTTNIAAPATPAAGTTRVYVDSTQKVLTFKNDAGTVGNAVVPSTCGANLFGTSISAAGVFGCTQPAIANISGFGTGVATALGVNVGSAGAFVTFNGAGGTPSSITLTNGTGLPTTGLTGTLQAAQEPAHTGDMTNTAGSLVTTVTRINGVDQTAAWSTWSPTFTTTTVGGTPITAGITGNGARYRQVGKTTFFDLDFQITNIGVGNSGQVTFTLPVTAVNASYVLAASGKEIVNTNKFVVTQSWTTTSGALIFYDATTPITANNRFVLGGFYETQ